MELNTVIPLLPPSISPELLEKMRRSVPLKIDSFGQWWHSNTPFEHVRLIHLFNQGLGWTHSIPPLIDPTIDALLEWKNHWSLGEGKVSIQNRWCYVECNLTPFLGFSWKEKESLWILTNHQKELEVVGFFEKNDVLFVSGTTHEESLLIRLDRLAQAQCIEWLEERSERSNFPPSVEYQIEYNKKVYPILPF